MKNINFNPKSFFLPIFLSILVLIGLAGHKMSAAMVFPQNLTGRILLEVESHGEAWYLNPGDKKRYYLGRPADAFEVMRKFGIGITDADLEKITVGNIYGIASSTIIPKNTNSIALNNLGKIFLQVQSHGEAWYIYPKDGKRYLLGRPADAFEVMRKSGLGISGVDINRIMAGSLAGPAATTTATTTPPVIDQSQGVFYKAAEAIMKGRDTEAMSYFTADMQTAVKFTLDFLDAEGQFDFGNILAGAKLVSSTDAEKIYSTTVTYAGYTKTLNFHVKKQPDEKWLLANLQ